MSVKRVTREELGRRLAHHGVQPTAQRLAVAEFALSTRAHPSADAVFAEVRARIPMISRATVYNTLNLLVRQGLLKQLVLAEGRVVFDPNVEPHHHFIDEGTGTIHDVAWDALDVRHVEALRGVTVREYQVVLRGAWESDRDEASAGRPRAGSPAVPPPGRGRAAPGRRERERGRGAPRS